MDIEDLKKIVNIAQTENLQLSAKTLNITAGALSKTIKKVEVKLNTQLFERSGRNIKINDDGKRFVSYANTLIHEFEQLTDIFTNSKDLKTLNICGPSIIVNYWFPLIIGLPFNGKFSYKINTMYEGEAVKQVISGQAHIGFVTKEAIQSENLLDQGLEYIPLSKTVFKLTLAKSHIALQKHIDGDITSKDLLNYGFVCPRVSPFCGLKRGSGSDGWPDNKIPRTVTTRTDDFSTLISLVQQGLAIAYLPDYLLSQHNLTSLAVAGHHLSNQEEIGVIYKPTLAYGWLNNLMEKIKVSQ